MQLNMLLGRDQVMPGRNLMNSVKQRTHLMSAELDGVIDGLGIPARGHSRGKQRFHFRREVERFLVEGVEQRLDAEAVARREHRSVAFIPQNKRKFAAQAVQALRAEIFVKMQSDFAVGSGAQAVARLFEFPLNRFVAVEFAVHHDVASFVLARDRLISGRQIDDAEPRVAKPNSLVGRNPVALAIGTAMIQALGGPLQSRVRDRVTARKKRNYTAHAECAP